MPPLWAEVIISSHVTGSGSQCTRYWWATSNCIMLYWRRALASGKYYIEASDKITINSNMRLKITRRSLKQCKRTWGPQNFLCCKPKGSVWNKICQCIAGWVLKPFTPTPVRPWISSYSHVAWSVEKKNKEVQYWVYVHWVPIHEYPNTFMLNGYHVFS